MRSVRIAYSKKERMKFVSHLDMNRYMTRLIKISGIPAWHTEGFNKHLYLTFALPMPLGVTCDLDYFDIKITDDDFSNQDILNALKPCAAVGIEILSVTEPKQKVAELKFAEFTLIFKDSDQELLNKLQEFFKKDSIMVLKKGKKGKLTEIDLAQKIRLINMDLSEGVLTVKIVLPAGNDENINPMLFIQAFCEAGNNRPEVCLINRNMLYNASMQNFE